MNLSVADLQQIVGGRLRLGDMPPRDGDATAIGDIVLDSRRVKEGDVFWGLQGTSFDGSHFAEDALARGAAGVVTSGRWVAPWAGRWSLEVDDSSAALWRLAAWNSDRFTGKLIAVEGAIGKSIATSMIDAVLAARLVGTWELNDGKAAAAAALALARLRSHDDYAVVELHEQTRRCASIVARLTRPNIAVITSAGMQCARADASTSNGEHHVRRAQALVASAIPVVLGADDSLLRRASGGARSAILVGRALDAHIAATDVESKDGRLSFTVHRRRFTVRVWGRHHLTSALSAIAVGRLLGLTWSEIALGLSNYRPLEHRCRVWHNGGVTAIEDTSGRHPAALRAGFAVLNEVAAYGRRVVVCSDLFDDEVIEVEPPRKFGEEAITQAGADLVVAGGRHADLIAQGAQAAGASPKRVIACATAEEALPVVRSFVRPGDAVLFCGRPSDALKQALVGMEAEPIKRAA